MSIGKRMNRNKRTKDGRRIIGLWRGSWPYYVVGSSASDFFKRNWRDAKTMWPIAKELGLRYYWDPTLRLNRYRHKRNATFKAKYGAGYITNRKAIRKRLMGRDGGTCVGKVKVSLADGVEVVRRCREISGLTIDHIIRRADGGSNDLSNLQLLCVGCHAVKSTHENLSPVGYPSYVHQQHVRPYGAAPLSYDQGKGEQGVDSPRSEAAVSREAPRVPSSGRYMPLVAERTQP